MFTARRSKKAVNVSISADLLQAARNGEINLSATLEAAVEHELRQLRKREWLEQSENAIQAYNHDVEEHGAFSVVPLAPASAALARSMRTLTPILKFEGKEFLMLTPQVAGIPARELGPVAGDLASDRDKIIAAVDFLLSGI